MKKKRVLVCGATGFIGRNTAEHLAKRDDFEVYGTYFNSAPYSHPRIRLQKVDLRDAGAIAPLLEGADIVVQAAAITSGAKDIVSRSYIHVTDNVVMNSLIFRAAHDAGVGHVLFPSCTIMYPSSDTPLAESDLNLNDEINPKYFGAGWTKVYEEKMCEFFSRFGKTKFTAFRHSNIYGAYDKYDLERSHVFAATVVKVMKAPEGSAVQVWGTGEEERDLLYIDDLTDFMERAIDRQSSPFELVNVGLGTSISVGSLVEKLIKASGKDLRIEFDPTKPTIKTKLALNCAKAAELFDWRPQHSLDQGIAKTLDWYRRNIK